MKKLIYTFILLTSFLICSCGHRDNSPAPPLMLKEMAVTIDSVWNSLNGDLEAAAARLAGSGIVKDTVYSVLNALLARHSYIVDAAYVDPKGVMKIIRPEFFSKHEGYDISGQDQIIRLMKTRRPVMSDVFLAVEGFFAVDIEYPVMKNGEYLGSVSALIRPESFLGAIIQPRTKGLPFAISAFDTTSRVLYDVDIEEIGRIVLTDSLYAPFPGTVEAAKKIISMKEGSTTYDFVSGPAKKKVKKEIYWQTLTNHGTHWRLALNRALSGGESPGITLSDLGIKELNQSFRFLATRRDLLEAVGKGDKEKVLQFFSAFYKAHPGLYTVELVDTQLVVPYGYPPENSLDNYRFNPAKDIAASYFLNANKDQTESIFECPLFEGRTGIFMTYPLMLDGKYLGMVYYIRIKP